MTNIWFDDNMIFDVAEPFGWAAIQQQIRDDWDLIKTQHIDLGSLETREDGWLKDFGNTSPIDITAIDSIIQS